jgi:hypothetical protein
MFEVNTRRWKTFHSQSRNLKNRPKMCALDRGGDGKKMAAQTKQAMSMEEAVTKVQSLAV